MGYRNYIASIPRKEYNEIKNFTKEELYKYKNEPMDDMGYVGVYNVAHTTLYELGKYVDQFPKMIDVEKINVLTEKYKNKNYAHIISYLNYEYNCGEGLAKIGEINYLLENISKVDSNFNKKTINSVKDISVIIKYLECNSN